MLPNLDRPLNIAHRGASKIAPENTMAAFQKALEIGADGIEFDVRLSSDGVPVVIHDTTVDGTTDGNGRVADLPLRELRRLDAGASFDVTFAGARIPTLAQVFEILGEQLLLNIELKQEGFFGSGLEEAVADLIQKHTLEQGVLVSSFNPLALRRIQRISPRLRTALLSAHPGSRVLRTAGLALGRPSWALHPEYAGVDATLVSWAHARGLRLHTWTVDDPADMRRLIRWGVDGIITNVPDVLRDVLDAIP